MTIENIGLIGSGNIGTAFTRGWVKADPSMASRIFVTDVVKEAAKRLADDTGVTFVDTNSKLVEKSDLVLVAVKPDDVEDALADTLAQFGMGKILASVAAGKTIASLEVLFNNEVPVCRLMPNVAIEICTGTISFASGNYLDPETEERVIDVLSPLGRVVSLPETSFAAATALGGSGPGFLALIVDAFVDAGVMTGLPVGISRELTYSMFLGTSKMLETGMQPSDLRHRVTSPGGTTAAGIAQLERDGTRSAIIDAIRVAVHRANELG